MKFCSVNEAARESGLSSHFLREGIKAGTVPYIMSGSKYLIDYDALMEKLREESNKSIQERKKWQGHSDC